MQQVLASYRWIFWDFDGVIKDSVESKAQAYQDLFVEGNPELVDRIKQHHNENGGVSRYEKIPTYLTWANLNVTQDLVDYYCKKFSLSVKRRVVNSAWVPGVKEFLIDNSFNRRFVLVTATPTAEIKEILLRLGLADIFLEVYGAPIEKHVVVREVMSRKNIRSEDALLVGDSVSDYEAALANGIEFALRRTPLNIDLQKLHQGLSFESLV